MESTRELPRPVANDLRAEPGDDLAVGRDREVREVPTDDAAEPLALFWYRVMPTTRQGHTDRLERHPHPLGAGATGQQEPTEPRPPADVDEPEEGERLRRAA